MTMIEWLASQKVCRESIDWLRKVRAKTPAEAISLCPQGDWLIWLAVQLDCAPSDISAAMRPSWLRAVRECPVAALDEAGLHDHAQALRALPDDVTAQEALEKLREAKIATKAHGSDAADWAYWICDAAVQSLLPQWSADVRMRYAARAIERAVSTVPSSDWTAAWEAEMNRTAAEVRAALPNLAARWSAAMEVEL